MVVYLSMKLFKNPKQTQNICWCDQHRLFGQSRSKYYEQSCGQCHLELCNSQLPKPQPRYISVGEPDYCANEIQEPDGPPGD